MGCINCSSVKVCDFMFSIIFSCNLFKRLVRQIWTKRNFKCHKNKPVQHILPVTFTYTVNFLQLCYYSLRKLTVLCSVKADYFSVIITKRCVVYLFISWKQCSVILFIVENMPFCQMTKFKWLKFFISVVSGIIVLFVNESFFCWAISF